MWGNLKSEIGNYIEIIVLLALIPIIISLWAGFAAAAGGSSSPDNSNWTLVGQLGNNTALGSGSTHGYYAIVVNNTIVTFNWNGSTTTFVLNLSTCSNITWGSSYVSGNSAILVVSGGKLYVKKSTTSSGTFNYNVLCDGTEIPPDPALKLYYYNSTGVPSGPPTAQATPASNIVNALFVIVLLAIASAVVGKVTG